jgi:hypothetical protein
MAEEQNRRRAEAERAGAVPAGAAVQDPRTALPGTFQRGINAIAGSMTKGLFEPFQGQGLPAIDVNNMTEEQLAQLQAMPELDRALLLSRSPGGMAALVSSPNFGRIFPGPETEAAKNAAAMINSERIVGSANAPAFQTMVGSQMLGSRGAPQEAAMANLAAGLGLNDPSVAQDVAGKRWQQGLVTIVDTKDPNDKGSTYTKDESQAIMSAEPGRYRLIESPGISTTVNVANTMPPDKKAEMSEEGKGRWKARERLRAAGPVVLRMTGLIRDIQKYDTSAVGWRLPAAKLITGVGAFLGTDPEFRASLSEWVAGYDQSVIGNIKVDARQAIVAAIPYLTGETSGRVTQAEQEISKATLGLEDKIFDPISAIGALMQIQYASAVVNVSDKLRADAPVYNVWDPEGQRQFATWANKLFGFSADPADPLTRRLINDVATIYTEWEVNEGTAPILIE